MIKVRILQCLKKEILVIFNNTYKIFIVFLEEIEKNDIDPIENGVQGVLQKIRDVFYGTKLSEMKQKGALSDVQKINKQLMILTFIETVAICGVAAWQVYYIKKLLNDRRLV